MRQQIQSSLPPWGGQFVDLVASRDGTWRQIGIVLSGHGLRLTLGLVSSILIARGLGPDGLSEFSVVGVLITFVTTFADFGLSDSGVRFLSRDLVADRDRARRVARAFSSLKLLTGLVMFALLIAMADPVIKLVNLTSENAPLLILIAGVGVLARTFSRMIATILQALQRFGLLVATQSLNSILTVILTAGLYFTDRLTSASALGLGVVTVLSSGLLGLAMMPPQWRKQVSAAFPINWTGEIRPIMGFGKWIWAANLLAILMIQLDLLLVNRLSTPTAAGLYALAFNLSLTAYILVQTLHVVLVPAASALIHRGEMVRFLRRNLVTSSLLAALLAVGIVFARPLILVIYGEVYAPSVGILYYLIAGVGVDLLILPLVVLVYPLNRPRLILFYNASRVLVLITMAWVLFPIWGINGVGLAKLIAIVSSNLVVGGLILQRLRAIPHQA